MSVFPKLKLVYFAAAGRADAARLAFHIGGVPFVDERISYEWFGNNKAKLPYAQLPVLEVDGHELAQSQAILRYAGRLAGLYPTNDPVAALKIDEILHALDEAQDAMTPSFREQDAEKKKALRTELAKTTLPRYLSLIEARLATHAQYASLQTRDVLVHEVALYVWVKALRAGYIDHIPTTVADGYPLLDKVFEKVANHAKVVEWFRIQHNTPKLKLTYFDFPGAAEPIRLAFHLGGIAFEDERISWDEFLQRKPALPFGQLPVLRVDDDEISQSLAILRYAGGLSGLYPSTDALAAFQIDEIFCAIEELRGNIGPSYHEKDDEKKLAMRKVLADETIPKVLGQLEKRVAANNQSGGSFAVGATLTVADLVIASQLDTFTNGQLDGVPTTVVDPFPALLKIREQVKAHPKVAEWNAAHA